jgi:hypothetical protein
MFQQNILDALASMGFGQMGWGQLSGLSSHDIASTLAGQYGVQQQDLPASMYQSITPQMLQAASYKTYAPQIQAVEQGSLKELYEGLGGRKATLAAGGFSGSGQFGRQQRGIRDVRGKSMADILTQVRGQQSQGIGLVSDLINQWQDVTQQVSLGT